MHRILKVVIFSSFLCIAASFSLRNWYNVDRLTTRSLPNWGNLTIFIENDEDLIKTNDTVNEYEQIDDEIDVSIDGVNNVSTFESVAAQHALISSNDEKRNLILKSRTRTGKRNFFGLILIPCK